MYCGLMFVFFLCYLNASPDREWGFVNETLFQNTGYQAVPAPGLLDIIYHSIIKVCTLNEVYMLRYF